MRLKVSIEEFLDSHTMKKNGFTRKSEKHKTWRKKRLGGLFRGKHWSTLREARRNGEEPKGEIVDTIYQYNVGRGAGNKHVRNLQIVAYRNEGFERYMGVDDRVVGSYPLSHTVRIRYRFKSKR